MVEKRINNLIFYDVETTDKLINFAQIIQCGSIMTDKAFNVLDSHNASCRPLPWVNPQPGALLTNKKVESFSSNNSHFQMMSDINYKWREWTIDQPGIFITFNGHAFDEELVRRQFYWNLLDIYITNTNGNGRLDLFTAIINLVAFFPNVINIPLHDGGPSLSLKLEHIAEENGIPTNDAHDAIADVNFMIKIMQLINKQNSDWLGFMMSTSTKNGLKSAINCKSFLCLSEYFRREMFRYPVCLVGQDYARPNEICFADLSYDPEELLDLNSSEIIRMLKTSGKNEPLKKYKINKTIPICPFEMVENKDIFDTDPKILFERAKVIRENKDFFEKVSQAMTDRIFNFPEAEYVEQKIYEDFPSKDDQQLIKDFHTIDDVDYKIKIAKNIKDDRYRELAERLICQMYADRAPSEMLKNYDKFLDERLNQSGPWGSTQKTLENISKLKINASDEDKIILSRTEDFILKRNF